MLKPGEKACAVSRDLLGAPWNLKNKQWIELFLNGRWDRWQIKDKLNRRYTKTIDLWFGGPETVQAARNFGRQRNIKLRYVDE